MVSIGILGFGDVAQRKMVPALNFLSNDFTLVEVGTRDHSKIIQDSGFNSFEAIVKNPEIEMIYIALPNHLHFEWAKKSLLAGKHVLCEKPLTISRKETTDLISIAQSQNLLLRENFQFVHHKQSKKIKEIVKSNILGKI
ncbi:Gfo/Idh/MocA family oxidoreductase, partial [Paracoccaceae bacterium]|nr:Gfo/Idh/MocA family oxidoreductase [Paracoccaceae bacterium]